MSTGSWLQRRYKALASTMNPPVFFGAGAVVIAFCIFGGGFTGYAETLFSSLQAGIARYFGWYYVLLVTAILVFSLWLGLSRVGKIRIGGAGAKPEFSRLSWLAMLFTAGMGIGLVFWSVAEPLTHFDAPRVADSQSEAAAREAMRLTFFHWGLHAWAIYSMLAVAVAYFHFNKGLPLAPRSILYPFLGERIHGWAGHIVDILCTVGTLLGVATSLGLGAQQINAGLKALAGISLSVGTQLTLIAIITLVATVSVVAGVKNGIRQLSRLNAVLALVLVGFVLLAGPFLYMLRLFVTTLGEYLQELPAMSLYVNTDPQDTWQADWTLFYWGWWISWSPFVAIFVARISTGRTLRDFVMSVLIVPVLATMIWLSIFGGAALHLESREGAALVSEAISTPATALHNLLEHFPLTGLMQAVATVLITIFFITSSDSGSLVDDMVTSGGHLHPPKWQRIFWATSEGVAAMTLLVVGGLQAMRNASISLGLPMSLVLIVAMVSLVRALPQDPQIRRPRKGGSGPAA
ncbi:BCCT family transporter [Henriciella aquimarina]|uniref:BCCT family transporter n=1 Tax=Henriciella aquimarina TaxID=545261 RepID=UPI000A02EF71|nr:BCCT family transporter [Henriciella aquimarina]